MTDETHEDLRWQAYLATVAWMNFYWGERCPDYNEHCSCCARWETFDLLFKEVECD